MPPRFSNVHAIVIHRTISPSLLLRNLVLYMRFSMRLSFSSPLISDSSRSERAALSFPRRRIIDQRTLAAAAAAVSKNKANDAEGDYTSY